MIEGINFSGEPLYLNSTAGPIKPDSAGITDAHSHLWIYYIPGAASDNPILDNYPAIVAELTEYHLAGGGTIIDCQPGGCGRDGRKLSELTSLSAVNIIASTGFHLKRYYPQDFWLFSAEMEKAADYFTSEIQLGLEETVNQEIPVKAGLIKIACEEKLQESPIQLLEAAASASLKTGAAIEIHTEKGSEADKIIDLFLDFGLTPQDLVLCHVDKKPDFGLHTYLAQMGVLLEYDTFFRPKYFPEENVWPLLFKMVENGYAENIAVATDMADTRMWKWSGSEVGMTGLMTIIIPRLISSGIGQSTIRSLVGANIAKKLARFPGDAPVH